MMMRMLKFGGLEVLHDDETGKRIHKHNPYGSLELEFVGKALRENDKEWTKGKVFKLVSPYILEHLPIDRPLKVIFMLRDVAEIISSLLASRNVWEYDPVTANDDARGYLEYNKIPTHFVKYRDCLKYPKSVAVGIADFLDRELDIPKMVSAVDPNARQRYKTDKSLTGYKHEDKLLQFQFEGDIVLENVPGIEIERKEL